MGTRPLRSNSRFAPWLQAYKPSPSRPPPKQRQLRTRLCGRSRLRTSLGLVRLVLSFENGSQTVWMASLALCPNGYGRALREKCTFRVHQCRAFQAGKPETWIRRSTPVLSGSCHRQSPHIWHHDCAISPLTLTNFLPLDGRMTMDSYYTKAAPFADISRRSTRMRVPDSYLQICINVLWSNKHSGLRHIILVCTPSLSCSSMSFDRKKISPYLWVETQFEHYP